MTRDQDPVHHTEGHFLGHLIGDQYHGQDHDHHTEGHVLGHLVGDKYHGQDHDHKGEDLLEDPELIHHKEDQSEDQDLGQGIGGHIHQDIESHHLLEDAH